MLLVTGYTKRMKRKIALLLAFVMVLSLLPMTVSANAPAFAALNSTGALIQGQGPATNVRHWDDGVIIGTPANAAAASAILGLPQAPAGNAGG